MILPIAFIIGAVYGTLKAKRQNGNKFDMLHYGTAYGIVFVLLTLLFSIILQRFGLF